MQKSGEEGPISRGEPHLLALQLSLEDPDLVAQGEDLRVFGPVTHWQQPQHRERVGHAEVRQSQQHGEASSLSYRRRSDGAWNVESGKIPSW